MVEPPTPLTILRGILPEGCFLSVWDGGDEVPDLMPGEEEAVARAVPGRRAEFARGRACARAALEEAGGPRCPIPAGPGRAPLWPPGFVGSITHCAGLVAAMVAPRRAFAGVGLDAEVDAALPSGVSRLVLHDVEREGVERQGLPEVALFSAKESVHKALHPATGVWLDFLDVEVRFEARSHRFRPTAAVGASTTTPRLGDLDGRLATGGGYVFAVSVLRD